MTERPDPAFDQQMVAFSAMMTYMDFQAKTETHQARFGRLTTRLMEQANEGLNILIKHRAELADIGILGPLSEAFRQQAISIEGLTENAAAEAENRAQLVVGLQEIVGAMVGHE